MSEKTWPPELTEDLKEVLGMMLWDTGPLAGLLRAADGKPIPRRAEDEQAFVLHWLVGLVLEHGPEWKPRAAAEIARMQSLLPPRSST